MPIKTVAALPLRPSKPGLEKVPRRITARRRATEARRSARRGPRPADWARRPRRGAPRRSRHSRCRPRLEDEPPLMQARVRNLEHVLIYRLGAVEEQVEVDRARPVTRTLATDAAEIALDLEHQVEQLSG